MNLKKIALLAALLGGLFISDARAQGFSGSIPSGTMYGNETASTAKPHGVTPSALWDRALGSTRGAVFERGASGWAIIGPSATAGLPFISNGTGADPGYGVAVVAGGGTNCSVASGTCLDNITGFSSTGYLRRTGAGAYAFSSAASSAQYFAGTATNVPIEPSVIYPAETTTTFGATTTFDFSTFINTAVTLTGNITTMTLSNVKAGQAGTITFIQDGTGNRTTVWNSIFKFAGGTTPTLSTGANKVDVLSYSCRSATFCVASLLLDVR